MDNDTEKALPGRQSFPGSQTQPRSSGSVYSLTQTHGDSAADSGAKPGANNFEIEWSHGITEEDKLLARRDKNAVDFVFKYSKLWCKSCKDIVLGLEKRAFAENEACRAMTKHFQALESSFAGMNGAPFKSQTVSLARMFIDHCKEVEVHNTKRCRELLEVLTRQRTLFERTRKHLKEKWKADLKRMVDAENALIKTKSAYYQRCQTGVKLREELAAAQNSLNELSALAATNSGVSSQTSSAGACLAESSSNLSGDAAEQTVADSGTVTSATYNQISKQRAKVERLEKQLSDNDKKEIEQTYAYREAVETANNRLYDLEKSKVEILCDIRLTILKSEEVVKDSLAEFMNHLFTTRKTMIEQYETTAAAFQDYIPCCEYISFLQSHAEKGTDYMPEKYQFAGFHEAAASGGKLDTSVGRFVSRTTTSAKDQNENDPLGCHSDSDSENECAVEGGLSGAGTRSSTLAQTSSNVLSSLVEFGSNLFRPDSKKSIRIKRGQQQQQQQQAAAADSPDAIAAQLASLEKDFLAACGPVARCIAAIEKQPEGLETRGIYRVPASKVKVAQLLELLQASQPTTPGQVADDIAVLSQEHPLTLAGLIKTQLISLPEPLLTYNLYSNFVDLGKAFDAADGEAFEELLKRLRQLIDQLRPGNRMLAGLLFHHLKRIAACQSENQMSSANLGTMFGPTVLRQKPKFQVANMMEFVDNKSQIRIVEVLIDQVVSIFGPALQYDPVTVLTNPPAPEVSEEVHSADSAHLMKLPSGNNLSKTAELAGNQTTSGLSRSATISTTSRIKTTPSALNALPLYTPYRDPHVPASQQTAVSPIEVNSAYHAPETARRLPNRSTEPEKSPISQPPTVTTSSSVVSTTVSTNQPESPSMVKGLRKFVTGHGPQSGQTPRTFVSSIGKQLTMGASARHQTTSGPSPDKQGVISNLVIGRRRGLGRPMEQPCTAAKTNKDPLDLDDYTFIDNDAPDGTSM